MRHRFKLLQLYMHANYIQFLMSILPMISHVLCAVILHFIYSWCFGSSEETSSLLLYSGNQCRMTLYIELIVKCPAVHVAVLSSLICRSHQDFISVPCIHACKEYLEYNAFKLAREHHCGPGIKGIIGYGLNQLCMVDSVSNCMYKPTVLWCSQLVRDSFIPKIKV